MDYLSFVAKEVQGGARKLGCNKKNTSCEVPNLDPNKDNIALVSNNSSLIIDDKSIGLEEFVFLSQRVFARGKYASNNFKEYPQW